jgi:prepilin-type processing-associated H-X9-DG protein
MKSRANLTKKDLFVVLGCVVFLLVNLGAIGSRGRRRAKEAVCICNLKQWGVIWKSYTDDHDGYFAERGGGGWSWEPPEGMNGWEYISEPYYKNHKILLCPEAVKPYDYGGKPPFASWMDENGEYNGSYCLNLWVANGDEDGGSHFNDRCWRTPYTRRAAYAPLLLDGNWKDAQSYFTDEPPPYYGFWWTPNADEMRRVCVDRHNEGVNGVFLDLSVRKIGLKELWVTDWHKLWQQDYEGWLDTRNIDWPLWMNDMRDFP